MKNLMKHILIIASILLLILCLAACRQEPAQEPEEVIVTQPADEEYVYVNPDETKAETDEGMTIDGVLDEAVYSEKNWLYLTNDDGGNHVNIAMTSHFGEKGMYIVFDVTESVPIYVNLDRAATLNSCIELYLAPPYVSKINTNTMFEIDLLPTGDISFKQTNGKYGYINVASTNDIMAYLGATTKGGEVNTPECYGYVLELFIPWDYMQWLGVDVDSMKDGYILLNPAHITSNNINGTNHDLDRYWYYYVQQIGTDFSNVSQYFRFDSNGVMGTTEITLVEGAHYSFSGNNVALPGMQVPITIIPEEGYALTSVLVDGQEQLPRTAFNEDGSMTVMVRCTGEKQTISAAAEAVTAGKKTLSGKIYAMGISHNGFKDVLASYVGPTGEKPITLDGSGNFQIPDLEPGFYTLRVQIGNYPITTHGVYVNRDMYVEVIFKTSVFSVTGGTCWMLDDESIGLLYKMSGAGNIISNQSYDNFTLETYVKYDPELAKLSSDDYHLQQRSGVRILFSNGKYWHINLLREGDKYILQYAKHAGNNSIFSWKNVHTLSDAQIAQYRSADGIKLTVKRVGNQAAICLGNEVLFIEKLAGEYSNYTAQVGFEAWIANNKMMTIPYSLTAGATLPPAPTIYFYAADTWNVTNQSNGVVYKTGVAGKDTWLDSAITANDITTTAKDLSPETNDYSMIYIFKFSNGEQFRVRLNHTDNDGRYRIQSMSSSTVFAPWKNHYTLTDEQAQLVQGDGIDYRVWIYGTTAYVYLNGQEVCTYDLSTVVATGQPSGIEKASVNVSLRMDGNIGKVVEVPFKLVQTNAPAEPEEPAEPETPIDPEKLVTLNIAEVSNGTVTPDKSAYGLGDTIKLKIEAAAGYAQKLTINGQPIVLDWKNNTYSFEATEKLYEISGNFEKSLNIKPSDVSRWDTANQAQGILNTYYPYENESWWLDVEGEYTSIAAKVKNYLAVEDSKDGDGNVGFSFVLRVTMDNGQFYAFRIINDKGTYAHDRFGGGSANGWGNWKALDAEAAAAINGDGVEYKLERTGANVLTLTVNGTVMETYTMAGITEANKVVSMGMRLYGNQGQYIEIPYAMDASLEEPPAIENPVALNLPTLENGTVTTDKKLYAMGDTVTLTITPNAGYAQQLFIDGAPLLLDWNTNTYSFVAEKDSYDITGSFVPAPNFVAGDSVRWSTNNMGHGLITTYYPNANDSWWAKINGEYTSFAITAKNYRDIENSYEGGPDGGWREVIYMQLDNGNYYAFSMWIDTNKIYAYQHFGGNISGVPSTTGWSGNWRNVSVDHPEAAAALNGEGAEFRITRTDGNHFQITLNGAVLENYTIPGATEANKVISVGTMHYGNKGAYVEIPFELVAVEEEPPASGNPVTLTLPDSANGTVTAAKDAYNVGDTITLMIVPNAGYSQKLYINGDPLLLDWMTNTYSFVATEEVYEITGVFLPALNFVAGDMVRWNTNNLAHGLITTYYPNDNDSWWAKINGEFTTFAITAKNYLAIENSYEGSSNGCWREVIYMQLDNGKYYAFSMWIDANKVYAYNHFGGNISGVPSTTGWGGNWRNVSADHPEAAAAINGEGAEFRITRIDGNHFQITLNGAVLETYEIPGVTEANKVVSVGTMHYGNKGTYVEIPFELN